MNSHFGTIFDIKRFALHDGPGTRTTIFLKGCPLHCQWCHNPEGISQAPVLLHFQSRCIHCGACVKECPEQALILENQKMCRKQTCSMCGKCSEICTSGAWEIVGTRVSCENILSIVKQDSLFYEESGGGITFSGGEPLYQIDFLETCLKLIKSAGYHITLDTSGCAPYESLERVIPYIDLLLFDIKMIDEDRHKQYTGLSNRQILSNFLRLSSMGVKIVVRVPVIPGVNDLLDEISSIGQFVRKNSLVNRIDLLPYHSMAGEKYKRLGHIYSLGHLKNLSNEKIEPLRQILAEMGFESITGG